MTTPSAALIDALVPAQAKGLVVALSGGLDSTVLLHIARADERPVRAIHINHQLQAEANHWAVHCERLCQKWAVPLTLETIDVQPAAGGLEAAAREARYACLRAGLNRDECLLTAHHADDQAETLWLRMLRGTGIDGLAGIVDLMPFANGWLARPLLDCGRDELLAYATTCGLDWLEDPSNTDVRHDRNYLRHQVMPLIHQRWPAAARSMVGLARHAVREREGYEWLLDERLARITAEDKGPLSLDGLRSLPDVLQGPLLRRWIRSGGQRPPSSRRLAAGLCALLNADRDRTPVMQWSDGKVLRHGDWLYRLPNKTPSTKTLLDWSLGLHSSIHWHGALRWQSRQPDMADLPAPLAERPLRVRAPVAGERIRLPGRPLKTLVEYAREASVLPWWRRCLPVVESDDGTVLGIGGLGLTQSGADLLDAERWRLDWQVAVRADGADWHCIKAPEALGLS